MAARSRRDLTRLFDPRSVAVLGASNDERKYGNWVSAQALTMTGRDVHLVNRGGEPVLGHPSHRSLADIGTPVDLVVIAVPAAGFERAVLDSLAAGARAIVGVTAGFAELGPQGRDLQARIVAEVRDAGAVLLGPNCLGLLDTSTGLHLTSNPLPTGRVALLSQSGNLGLELSQFLAARGHGFSRFVSLGNQADLDVVDMVRQCIEHEATDLIAVYCEDFGDGREFVAASAEAALAGKPVVLLTVGGGEASVRTAASHTGALTSSSVVVDAACRAAGVHQVSSPRQLADAAGALLSFGNVPVRRLAVVSDGGGHAGVASDLLEASGLQVPELSEDVSAQLRDLLPTSAAVNNPVDIAGAGERDISSFTAVLETVLASPGVDAVLLTGYFGAYGEYGPGLAAAEVSTAGDMAEAATRHGKALLVHTMRCRGEAAAELARGGVPVFEAVDDAVAALAVLGSTGPPRPPRPAVPPAPPVTSEDYWDARRLFGDAGVPFPPAVLVTTADEAAVAADRIGYPVVLKAMGLLHKSDSGGVALGLQDADRLVGEVARMQRHLQPPAFTIEAMTDTRDAVELIVGVQADPRWGPVAMVGMGGVHAEVLADVAFALAPVTADEAQELLLGLRAAALLGGVRGKPAVDVRAAAQVVAAVTRVAAAHPEIAEMEINPLLATPAGAIGLDARVLLHPTH